MAEDNTDMSTEEEVDALDVFNEITGDSPSEDSLDEVETSDQVTEEAETTESQAAETEDPETRDETVEDSEQDIWAGASDAQIEAYRKLQTESLQLQNNVKANSGRVSALTKKLDELRRAEQSTSQSAAPKLDGKSFQEVEEEWPEVAEYVRAQVANAVTYTQSAMRKELEPLRAGYENFTATQETNAMNSELEQLSQAHPDWQEVNASPEFEKWLSTKPAGIQSLRGSMSAADNIELLNIYKAATGVNRAPQQAQETDLSSHAELPRKGAGQPQGVPEDPAEYFDLIVSQM